MAPLLTTLAACGGTNNKESSGSDANNRPNVLVITIDDMRDWAGFLDGYEGTVHTPNMDRLAAQGIGFTNAHTASPQCCPSRNAFFTGKRPSTTGLYENDVWWKTAHPDLVTLPQYFKNHGYFSAGAGKIFHHTPGNNPPVSWNEYQDQVFDDPWNFSQSNPTRYFLEYGYRGAMTPLPDWKPLHGMEGVSLPMDWGPIPGLDDNDYGDIRVVDYGRDFLKRNHDQPFFLALGIYKPHIPWHVPQKYFDLYPLDQVVLPAVMENDLDDVPAEGRRLARKRSRDFDAILKHGKWKEGVQAYLANISFVDDLVGDILESLETSGHADNTIVVLWSDHGFQLGHKQTWHKWTLWEDVTRIPFIMKVPGMETAGSLCHQPVDMLNVFPTLVSLCDLPMKAELDGHDMTPLLDDPGVNWPWPAITEYGPGQVAVRTMDWRFIRYSDGSEELYDRNKDPHEWHNLALNNQYEDVLQVHRQWVPSTFADQAIKREEWFFDPCSYTFLHRTSGVYIDGNK